MDTALNILLVEDDNDDFLFFAEALEELNIPHQVTFAKNCFDVFKLFENGKYFDLIFLDINLPFSDGMQCLKQVKANEKYRNIPVIILTGSHAQSDIDFAYEFGAHYHIVKPYAHINYLASMKTVLEINWKKKQPRPSREHFVVNLSFSN
jgi:CheY-like chemotaxis protein